MAEMVIRKHRRRVDRWMPRERRFLTAAQIRAALILLARMAPGYVLTFADMLGIPSGLSAAYTCALCAAGRDARWTLAGSAMAVVIRALSGLAPRWELLVTLTAILCLTSILAGRGTVTLMAITAASLLPTVVVGFLSPTAAQMVQSWACAAIAALSAPVMVRALKTLEGERQASSMEERVAVGYLAAMLLCGAVRMTLLGVNIGVMGASVVVLGMAMFLGTGAGAVAGMLSGLVAALQGLPLFLAIALPMGGFLAGVANSLGRRGWTCAAFAMGAYLPMLLCGATGLGMGSGVLAGTLVMMLLPRVQTEQLQRFLRRFLPGDPTPGDAYAASALKAWEQTIAAMALAIPSPADLNDERNPSWWESRLCQGCPEYEGCGCMTTDVGMEKAEEVWACRTSADEVWQGALENLRGMGCHRLYYLMDSMNALRREDEADRRTMRQAEAQRDMLVTHLTAMSGAARRFAMFSGGESWWDDRAARRIRKELSEHALPVQLSFVRRVQGHVQAAFELQYITGARKQAEELCTLVSAVLEAPMQLMSLDGDRVLLAERPLFSVEAGAAAEAITGGTSCGDTPWWGQLQDGRYMVILSDGMGHGDNAALISRQTAELVRLCLDAGYTCQQTLTAVNGMLLMGGSGERFATADILLVDLWNGQASLYKLGAACSWLYHEGALTRLPGDSLPLGIIETVDCRAIPVNLAPEDALVLLSDGVEDAFRTSDALQNALMSALTEPTADDAAEAILLSALSADDGQRRDDQSAVVVRLRKMQA